MLEARGGIEPPINVANPLWVDSPTTAGSSRTGCGELRTHSSTRAQSKSRCPPRLNTGIGLGGQLTPAIRDKRRPESIVWGGPLAAEEQHVQTTFSGSRGHILGCIGAGGNSVDRSIGTS